MKDVLQKCRNLYTGAQRGNLVSPVSCLSGGWELRPAKVVIILYLLDADRAVYIQNNKQLCFSLKRFKLEYPVRVSKSTRF